MSIDRNNEDTMPEDVQDDSLVEDDRISILQWILLFATLGVIVYLSPMLLSLFPK